MPAGDRHILRHKYMVRVEGKDAAHVVADKLAGPDVAARSSGQRHPVGIGIHYGLGVLPGALNGPHPKRVNMLAAAR